MSWCAVLSRHGSSIQRLTKAPFIFASPARSRLQCLHDSLVLKSPRLNHRHPSCVRTPSTFHTDFGNMKKTIYLQRHGQAQHNVNAEPMRESGCSYEEFLEQMRIDDALDSDLTSEGKQQAQSIQAISCNEAYDLGIELLVASPLSRAIETSQLAFPQHHPKYSSLRRCVLEEFREINGLLLNGKRRSAPEIAKRFPSWDLSTLKFEEDVYWTSDRLEDRNDRHDRLTDAMAWLFEQPESNICVTAHGGILGDLINNRHPLVTTVGMGEKFRFKNCQLCKFIVTQEVTEDWDGGIKADESNRTPFKYHITPDHDFHNDLQSLSEDNCAATA
eukprot:m.1424108 g.1424108  ORF g.1424108 m.1424108 type:complete len:331 (-) comp25060_c0_seq1:5246-6238(-)